MLSKEYGDGLAEAARVVKNIASPEPDHLRFLARSLSGLDASDYERGMAAGLILAADDIEDDMQRHVDIPDLQASIRWRSGGGDAVA